MWMAPDSATDEGPAPAAAVPSRRFFPLVDQLRGVAALLVVYAHLVANFLESTGHDWMPKSLVDRFLQVPLHGELSMAWPGVALFFFISGFVVTHAASSETTAEFAVKRFLRIYPPVLLAALVAAVLAWCGVLVTGLAAAPGAGDLALSVSLANFLVPGSLVLVAVGWTLVIEVMFYLLVGALRPLLARRPFVVPLVILAICLAAALALPVLSAASRAITYLVFVPVLAMGQVIYLTRMRRIPVWGGALLIGAAWLVFVFGMERADADLSGPASSFFANVALAGSVFVIAVLAEGRVGRVPGLAVVARRSFSLYLLHVPVGFTILTALVVDAQWPYTAAIVVALAATAAATELSYRFVEKPSTALARRISRRIRRAP